MPPFPDDPAPESRGERPFDRVDLSGESLGPYRLQSLISESPVCQVYRGLQAGLEQSVVVKVFKAGDWLTPLADAGLQQELRLLAELRHPNLVRLLYAGEVRRQPALALEFVGGRSLAHNARGQKLTVRETLPLLLRISRAVGAAHEQQLAHRNLRPENILFDISVHDPEWQTRFGFVKVTDFGAAGLFRSFEERLLLARQPERLRYLAPEQLAGRRESIGPATDVHALGLLGWELLTGQPAYASFPRISDQLRHIPPPLDTQVARCPTSLSLLVARCLEKNPNRRYPDANAVADELALIREQLLIETYAPSEATSSERTSPKKDSEAAMTALTATDLATLPELPAVQPKPPPAPAPPLRRRSVRCLLLALLVAVTAVLCQIVFGS